MEDWVGSTRRAEQDALYTRRMGTACHVGNRICLSHYTSAFFACDEVCYVQLLILACNVQSKMCVSLSHPCSPAFLLPEIFTKSSSNQHKRNYNVSQLQKYIHDSSGWPLWFLSDVPFIHIKTIYIKWSGDQYTCFLGGASHKQTQQRS